MIKKFICFSLAILLSLALSISSFAYYGESLPRLIDDADLLTDSEEISILNKLDEIADTAQFDVIAATVNTLDGKTPQEYADDLYDYNDFGLGAQKDGILLLISMEDRDVYISTTGYGIELFSDGVWDESILNKILPYLSDGRYFEAIEYYASLCAIHIAPEHSDAFGYSDVIDEYEYYYDDYDYNYSSSLSFDYIRMIPVSVAIGMVISLLIMLSFRSKLKSVRSKPAAHDYQIPGSMHITHQSDMYLYSRVTKVPRQTNNSSSRGGGTHSGSSGRSHGGGGAKF